MPDSPESSSLSYYDDTTLTSTTLNSSSTGKKLTTLTLNGNKSQFNSLNLLLNGSSTTNLTTSNQHHNNSNNNNNNRNSTASTLLGLNVGSLSSSLQNEICNDLSEFIGDELSLSSELNQCSSSNSPIEFNLLNSNNNHLSNLDHSSLMKCNEEDQFILNCDSNQQQQQTTKSTAAAKKQQTANDQSINQFLTQTGLIMTQVENSNNTANANLTSIKLLNDTAKLTNSSTLIYTPEHSLASNSSGSNHINSLVSGTGSLTSGLNTSFTHSLNELEDLQDVLQLDNPCSWATELNSYNLTPISDLDSLDTASSSSGSTHFEFPDYPTPEVSDILGEDWCMHDLGLTKTM